MFQILVILNVATLFCATYLITSKFLSSSKSLRMGFSILFLSGIFQALISLLMVLFSVGIRTSITLSLIALDLIFIFPYVFRSVLTLNLSRTKSFSYIQASLKEHESILVCLASSLTLLFFSGLQWFQVGDQGWDSNAYHLPLVGVISENGLREWPIAMQSGTYTIFSPFGPHLLSAIWVALAGTLQASIFTNWVFYLALCLLTLGAYEEILQIRARYLVSLLVPLSLACVPSIWGQLSHFYIDLVAGTYWFGAFIALVLLIKSQSKNHYHWIMLGLLSGCAVSSKTHQLYALIPLFISAFYYLSKFIKKRSDRIMYVLLLAFCFTFSVSSFFLRNWIEFRNPVFPFKVFSWRGTMTVAEVKLSFENFVPSNWPTNQIGRLLESWILSPTSSIWDIVKMKLGVYDPNRPDLTVFTYDTVTGGLGVVSVIFILLSFALFLLSFGSYLFNSQGTIWLTSRLSIYLLTIPLVSSLITPGAWWSRYNLGPGLAISLPGMLYFFRLVETFRLKGIRINLIWTGKLVIVTGVFSLIFCSGLLAYNFRGFEVEAAGRKVATVKPNLGLSQGVSSAFMNECGKVAVIEPRPTFTNYVWEAKCELTTSVMKGSITDYVDSQYDYFVTTEQYCAEIEKSSTLKANFRLSIIRAWFDSNGTYSSCLMERFTP